MVVITVYAYVQNDAVPHLLKTIPFVPVNSGNVSLPSHPDLALFGGICTCHASPSELHIFTHSASSAHQPVGSKMVPVPW